VSSNALMSSHTAKRSPYSGTAWFIPCIRRSPIRELRIKVGTSARRQRHSGHQHKGVEPLRLSIIQDGGQRRQTKLPSIGVPSQLCPVSVYVIQGWEVATERDSYHINLSLDFAFFLRTKFLALSLAWLHRSFAPHFFTVG
jgi:hypothetical protein